MDQTSDEELRRNLRFLAGRERRSLADVLRLLAELDSRGTVAAWGCPTLFAYCVAELGLSEPATYYRVRAARIGRRWPEVFALIERGELSLEGVGVLAPHLWSGGPRLLEAGRRKTLRQLRELVGPEPRRSAELRERRARQLGLRFERP